MNAINSNEQMIEKINEILQSKKDTVVNIVNDKLTISVFSLLERNLQNVKEINFVIRDAKFLPQQSEISHEFEINPTDALKDPSIGIYFIVETKAGKTWADLTDVEKNKIHCGELHFQAVSDHTKFDWVNSYEDFINKFGVADTSRETI